VWSTVAALAVAGLSAQGRPTPAALPDELSAVVDAAAQAVLAATGVPGAEVAVVRGGRVAVAGAYGSASLAPARPVRPDMRFAVGSISKQFTAAAMLLLQEDGKLSLDDRVARFLPTLTRASDITIRELLSHTSGYQDYWPQDYLMPPMREAATAQHILDVWGKKALDFDPGTRWQYSNTNFVIAGRIVEMVSGMQLMPFLQQNVFRPLNMEAVWNSDAEKLGDTDAEGYIRYALGPLRPAPKEGKGWMFAAGELAMPAYDLAQWDISVMDRSLLSAKSYEEMTQPVKLKDGTDSHYALGLFVRTQFDRPMYEHSGEVSGFVSENLVFPTDKAAIAVLTNQDASPAAAGIGRALAPIVLGIAPDQAASRAESQAREIFAGLQQGKIDRALFTDNCNAYFDHQALGDFESSLKALGEPSVFTQATEELRGGMTFRVFRVEFPKSAQHLRVTTYTMPDGKLEQYLVIPAQ
jgi:D-alanyl-D-alanine carboxypeptidase